MQKIREHMHPEKKGHTKHFYCTYTGTAPIHLKFLNWAKTLDDISELLKQPGQQRKRKLHSKSESLVLQTSLLLISLVQFVKCSWIFLELNHKGLYQNAEEEKRSLKPPKKREIWGFHIVFVPGNVNKYSACAKVFCQSKPNPFQPFSLPSLPSLLKLPIISYQQSKWFLKIIILKSICGNNGHPNNPVC